MKTSKNIRISPDDTWEEIVVKYYRRNGCVRVPSPARVAKESRQVYKKGYEVRICVDDARELQQLRTALAALDFKPGKPYSKHPRIVQPIYGKEALSRFEKLLENAAKPRRPEQAHPEMNKGEAQKAAATRRLGRWLARLRRRAARESTNESRNTGEL